MEMESGKAGSAKKKSPRAAKKKYAAVNGLFERMDELNKLIDQGGEIAKDAKAAKAKLIEMGRLPPKNPNKPKKKLKGKKKGKVDLLNSRKRLPGSFESGKRR